MAVSGMEKNQAAREVGNGGRNVTNGTFYYLLTPVSFLKLRHGFSNPLPFTLPGPVTLKKGLLVEQGSVSLSSLV